MDVGCIGAGVIARSHLSHLDEIEDVSVTAICDVDESAAREAAAARGAAVYTDHEAMYAREALDAVFVCVPPFAHSTQELAAVERDIPFLVEKPLALSMGKPRDVRDAVAAADLVTQVGYQRRYHPVVEWTRDLLDDRQVVLIDGQRQTDVPDKDWWKVKARSGGQIVEMTTHDFDLARHLAGEVERVTTYGGHAVVDEIDFADATTTTMTHASGAVSDLSATSASPDWNSQFTVVAEDARLAFDYLNGRLSGTVDGEAIDRTTDADARRRQDLAFVRAVREDDPELPRSPYADAVGTLELTLAATESLDDGGEVVL